MATLWRRRQHRGAAGGWLRGRHLRLGHRPRPYRESLLTLRGHGRAERQEHRAASAGLCAAPEGMAGCPRQACCYRFNFATPRCATLSIVVLPSRTSATTRSSSISRTGSPKTHDRSVAARRHFVISRSTAFTYRNKRSTQAIGRELGVPMCSRERPASGNRVV